MKNLIKKILKEENDFDWAKDIEPIPKSEIADELKSLKELSFRRDHQQVLVELIYRLGLGKDKITELSRALNYLGNSIWETGREIGVQDGWGEGYNEGYREGKDDGVEETEKDYLETSEGDWENGYEEGVIDGRTDMETELKKGLEEQKSIIYNKGFEEGRAYEIGLDVEDLERKESGFDPREYDEDYDDNY